MLNMYADVKNMATKLGEDYYIRDERYNRYICRDLCGDFRISIDFGCYGVDMFLDYVGFEYDSFPVRSIYNVPFDDIPIAVEFLISYWNSLKPHFAQSFLWETDNKTVKLMTGGL